MGNWWRGPAQGKMGTFGLFPVLQSPQGKTSGLVQK
jgi:hypothetical protein